MKTLDERWYEYARTLGLLPSEYNEYVNKHGYPSSTVGHPFDRYQEALMEYMEKRGIPFDYGVIAAQMASIKPDWMDAYAEYLRQEENS